MIDPAPEVYFNEIDEFAADWLANLFPAGLIDRRSIADVRAVDVLGRQRAHFFAGIGGWEYALRLAGWPADRPVWTGSCPCQPFSSAGRRKARADERHLWPEFLRLIAECRPPTILGEQVASRLGREWLAGVRADLEALGYAVGAADLCAAGVGAPHIRQRLYWVAHAQEQRRPQRAPFPGGGGIGVRSQGDGGGSTHDRESGGLVSSPGTGSLPGPYAGISGQEAGAAQECGGLGRGPTRPGCPGYWSAYDLIPCHDGKTRRVEPGSFPLAHGVPRKLGPLFAVLVGMGIDPGRARVVVRASRGSPAAAGRNRVGRLRGYGNAIVPRVAEKFITAFMEATGILPEDGR